MKIEELLKQITPLPWEQNPIAIGSVDGNEGLHQVCQCTENPISKDRIVRNNHRDINAAYLCHAANMLPQLIEALGSILGLPARQLDPDIEKRAKFILNAAKTVNIEQKRLMEQKQTQLQKQT